MIKIIGAGIIVVAAVWWLIDWRSTNPVPLAVTGGLLLVIGFAADC